MSFNIDIINRLKKNPEKGKEDLNNMLSKLDLMGIWRKLYSHLQKTHSFQAHKEHFQIVPGKG